LTPPAYKTGVVALSVPNATKPDYITLVSQTVQYKSEEILNFVFWSLGLCAREVKPIPIQFNYKPWFPISEYLKFQNGR
jgi:hypothetical protein